MDDCTYRKAQPDELHLLIAVDDAASELYYQAGLTFDLDDAHPFVQAESARWGESLAQGDVYVALDAKNTIVGFAVLAHKDGEPYLDQLSVHPTAMRQGIGAALLSMALGWSDGRPLWLTTYSHLPWNKPYYEKYGFVEVSEAACAVEIQRILREQRAYLPEPQLRVAMVHR